MSMNDRYYEPNQDELDRAWDIFVDYCESNGLNPDDEDFEQWVEDQHEAAEEAAAERAIEAMEDRMADFEPDYDY